MTTVPFRSKTSAASLFAALRKDAHAPMSAMIEIADRCNEVCVHCYQIQGQKGEMTTEQVKQVLDELAQLGVLFLTISGGEPTLRDDFLELVAHARKLKFAVKIFTNGLTMTPELAKQLKQLAVQEVQISLYSHRAELHDWVTRVPGSFEKSTAGARALVAEGVAVVLKTPLMAFNAPEYPAYIDFVTSIGADYMMDPSMDARENGDLGTAQLRVDDATYVRVRTDPRLVGEASAERSSKPRTAAPLESSVCGACSGNVHIEANGEMRPCTLLGTAVGHALRDGVAHAYEHNPDALAIRHLTWADLHGCRDCDLRAYCGRCFSNSHMETGDAMGPYRSACHRARLNYEVAHGVAPTLLAASEPSRDPRIGPYAFEPDHALRPIPDVLAPRDVALAARHSWVKRSEGPAVPSPEGRGVPGGLIQIRRPGAKQARLERVPGPAPSAPSDTNSTLAAVSDSTHSS